MAAISVFFCFHANWPLWPRLNILSNFTFESEVIRANLHGNKRILKWWPFWNKVYSSCLSVRPYSYSQYWTGTSLQWRLAMVLIVHDIVLVPFTIYSAMVIVLGK